MLSHLTWLQQKQEYEPFQVATERCLQQLRLLVMFSVRYSPAYPSANLYGWMYLWSLQRRMQLSNRSKSPNAYIGQQLMTGSLHGHVLIGSWTCFVTGLHAEGLNHCWGYAWGQDHTTQGPLCLDDGVVLQELSWYLHACIDCIIQH